MRRFIRPAVLSDTGPAAALLGRAFADDRLYAWVIPDEKVRRQRLPGLFAAQLGIAQLGGFETDVMCAGGQILGCALWWPPGASPSVLQQLAGVATFPLIPWSRMAVALSTFYEIGRARPKEPPHWYLSCLGVDPPAQRTGVARGLLTPRLAQCDGARAEAALISGEVNVPFYEAFGFTATLKIKISGNGPTHWVMWRNPGGGGSAFGAVSISETSGSCWPCWMDQHGGRSNLRHHAAASEDFKVPRRPAAASAERGKH